MNKSNTLWHFKYSPIMRINHAPGNPANMALSNTYGANLNLWKVHKFTYPLVIAQSLERNM